MFRLYQYYRVRAPPNRLANQRMCVYICIIMPAILSGGWAVQIDLGLPSWIMQGLVEVIGSSLT